MAPLRLHILGASGSGTTTLGRLLAQDLGLRHFDTDDFFWEPSDPPYQQQRSPDQRLTLLRQALNQHDRWILSGSLCGWGDPLVPLFDAVIFVTLPADLRLERMLQRERVRYGSDIEEGGYLYHKHVEFMAWAAGYDDPFPTVGRSRVMHESWLTRLQCPVIHVDNSGTPQLMREHVSSQVQAHLVKGTV